MNQTTVDELIARLDDKQEQIDFLKDQVADLAKDLEVQKQNFKAAIDEAYERGLHDGTLNPN